MKKLTTVAFAFAALVGLNVETASAQAVGGAAPANPVQGDEGIYSMNAIEGDIFRVLRDYAEPGATRRMHNHTWATFHTLMLATGTLRVQVDGEPAQVMGAGEVISIPGGAMHTFTNIGEVTATIIEVFGKEPG